MVTGALPSVSVEDLFATIAHALAVPGRARIIRLPIDEASLEPAQITACHSGLRSGTCPGSIALIT